MLTFCKIQIHHEGSKHYVSINNEDIPFDIVYILWRMLENVRSSNQAMTVEYPVEDFSYKLEVVPQEDNTYDIKIVQAFVEILRLKLNQIQFSILEFTLGRICSFGFFLHPTISPNVQQNQNVQENDQDGGCNIKNVSEFVNDIANEIIKYHDSNTITFSNKFKSRLKEIETLYNIRVHEDLVKNLLPIVYIENDYEMGDIVNSLKTLEKNKIIHDCLKQYFDMSNNVTRRKIYMVAKLIDQLITSNNIDNMLSI